MALPKENILFVKRKWHSPVETACDGVWSPSPMERYAEYFRSYRRDVSDKARQYISGLMQAGARKNIDRMSEIVPDAVSRNLQQFLTYSKWDYHGVMDHVARDADKLLGDGRNACILIDERSFVKKGKNSVGVFRHWLGCLDKMDNGQVAVSGALTNGRFALPIDMRLYLPEEWIDDPARCKKAAVPEEDRRFRTKPELAIEIVRHAQENGIRFGWVGAGEGYGKEPGFCAALDELGQRFVVDVHSDFHVYLKDPKPYRPQEATKRGRSFTKYQTDLDSIEVRELVNSLPAQRWKTMKIYKSTHGSLRVRISRLRVYVWDGASDKVHCWTLVATRSLHGKPEVKISLTNAPDLTAFHRVAWIQLQRYWVEREFEEAKSECGMADYQVRKWIAWHHHMALVMMAMLFRLTERVLHEDTYPMPDEQKTEALGIR